MQTKIRLTRVGAKKKPFYRIVVSSITSPRDGRSIEVVGHYDPKLGVGKASIKKERISYWVSKGAQPTEIVRQILKTAQAAT